MYHQSNAIKSRNEITLINLEDNNFKSDPGNYSYPFSLKRPRDAYLS